MRAVPRKVFILNMLHVKYSGQGSYGLYRWFQRQSDRLMRENVKDRSVPRLLRGDFVIGSGNY